MRGFLVPDNRWIALALIFFGWLKDRFGSAEFSVFYAAGLIVLALGLVVWLRCQQTQFSEGRRLPGKAAST